MQYLKKEVSDEFDFLRADKHDKLLQIDTMILKENSQNFQNSKFAMFYNTSKKNLEMKLIFCKIRASYKLVSTLWASKFLTFPAFPK